MKSIAVRTAMALVSLSFLTSAARADVGILYYNDYTIGTDSMGQALANLGPGYTVYTASSDTDFQTQLATGNYSLGIFFAQDFQSSNYTSAISALATFAQGGGGAIYADWSQNGSLAAGFGAGFTGNTNESQFTVSDPALANGITNPVNLNNPGWGVFSTGLTGSNVAATFVSDGNGAIVIGDNGHAIVNGFLNDTFADANQGTQLYTNEIKTVLYGTAVPEPSTFVLMCLGAAGFAGFGVRRRLQARAA